MKMHQQKISSKWILIAAARPNFMKIAPLLRAINSYNNERSFSDTLIKPILVHTGQHYDRNMSDDFFRDLKIATPDIHMGIGSGSHAEQTGRVMIEFEKILIKENPDVVIVVGDVNSTVACALAAVKIQIPVAHVEAGLRSFDRTMPEEINRLVTDVVADYLFTPSPDADENLLREGCSKDKIFLVGDVMVDSLLFHLEKAKLMDTMSCLGLKKNGSTSNGYIPYALLTLHRPANVDNGETFSRILKGLKRIALQLPIIFPVHPRTKRQIDASGLSHHFIFHETAAISPKSYVLNVAKPAKIHCLEPQGYLAFLNLMMNAKFVLTDSGGIQEETTVLNIPCITIRNTTERPITISEGTNVLVGDDPERIFLEAKKVLDGQVREGEGKCPKLWDGNAAKRIVKILLKLTACNGQNFN